jgi:hypothetical protein
VNTAEYSLHLAEQGVGVLIAGLPVTIALVAAMGLGVFELVRTRSFSIAVLLWSLVPAVVPFLILLYGSVFRLRGSPVQAEVVSAGTAPILVLIASCAVVGALIAWRIPKGRWMIVSATTMFVWWSIAAGFVSSMAVTGDWL